MLFTMSIVYIFLGEVTTDWMNKTEIEIMQTGKLHQFSTIITFLVSTYN